MRNRNVVIDNDFSQDSPEQHSSHVDAMGIHVEVGEEVLDSEVVFGKCGNCTKEVAVSEAALKDISRLNFATHELRVLDDVGDSLPGYFTHIINLSDGGLVRWELGISPLLSAFVVFLDEFVVVGLQNLLYDCVAVVRVVQEIAKGGFVGNHTVNWDVVDKLVHIETALPLGAAISD